VYSAKIVTLITLACIPLGFVLIILSVFLYDSEEKRIQDTLEGWWITLDDQGNTWAERTALLTRSVAKTFHAWLNELFGRSTVSMRALIACLSFSLSSILLLSFSFGLFTWFKPITVPIPPMRVIAHLFGGGLLFFVATRRRHDCRHDAILSIVFAMVLGGTTAFYAGTSGRTVGLYAGLAVGVACNYVVLALARQLASFGSYRGYGLVFLMFALLNAAVFLSLLIGPMLAMNTGAFGGITADVLGFGSISNFFSGVVAVSFMLLALIASLPRATWPLLSRPLYALQRFRVLQKRKTLFSAGSGLIIIGVPALSEVRNSIVSLFIG
jgi:hypothetical protein